MRENRKLEIGGDSCTRQRFLCPASVIENPQPASQPACSQVNRVDPFGQMDGCKAMSKLSSPTPLSPTLTNINKNGFPVFLNYVLQTNSIYYN